TSVTGPVIRPISSPPVIDFDAGLVVLCSISAERGSAFPHAIACRGQVLSPSRWACKCHTFPSWCTPRHNALSTGGERTRPGLIDISATHHRRRTAYSMRPSMSQSPDTHSWSDADATRSASCPTNDNNMMTRFVLVSHQRTTPDDLGGTH